MDALFRIRASISQWILRSIDNAIDVASGRQTLFCVFCIAAVIGLNSSIAQAFCWTTTEQDKYKGCPETGIPLYLECSNIVYSICPREIDEPPFDEVVEIIEDSFLTWALIECGGEPLDFQFILEEEPKGCDQYKLYNRDTEVDPTPDENLIMFVQDWDAFDEDDDGSDAYALTFAWHDIDTGVISGFDMVINDSQLLGRLGICEKTTEDCDDIVDIQNLFTHEIGHLLGLGHTDVDPAAVMFPTSLNGDIDKRVPKADDIEGICEIYSENSLSFCSEAQSRQTMCACTMVGGSRKDGHFSVEILFLFIAILAVVFRKRV